MIRFVFLGALALTCNAGVHAKDTIYECKASQRLVVNDKGRLEQVPLGPLPIKFEVNRNSGKFNFLMGSINLGRGDARVVDRGSKGHSFKVIWEEPTETGKSVGYLQVHEYVDSTLKPFVAVDHMQVLSGTCH